MRFVSTVLFLFEVSFASARPTATTNTTLPTVVLDYSTVIATAGNSSLGYYKYQNIRFAAAPTGLLRWAKPQWPPIETEVNTGDLTSSDVACNTQEDCLYLDVWTPANSTGKKLPVIVWTYGGGFTGGSKSQNTPEGLFNLSKDFIFVAYNYRLGITGLGNGPTYAHEGGATNTAIWDVQHAFEWTKKYIGAFGGDKDQITAMGFSAGASQVLFQMTRFAGHAEQLFKQAWVMSPGFVPGAGHHHAERFWQNVSTAVGCSGGKFDCMRKVDFSALNTAANSVTSRYTYQFQPRVDGDIISDTYEAQFYQGRFNFSGPMVLSHELHEGNSQPWAGVSSTADVARYLRLFFPAITDDIVEEALDLYPESAYASPGLRFADMKQSFDLTAHNLAATAALKNDTWNAQVALGAATHGTDQGYYFYSNYTLLPPSPTNFTGPPGGIPGGPPGGGFPGMQPVNPSVAVQMQKYLLSFVLTGDPNAMWKDDTIYWPKYSEGNGTGGTQIIFNTTFSVGSDDLANEKSLFWNKVLWY